MKQLITAVRSFAILTILTGFLYPFLTTKFAQGIFPHEANGSLVRDRQGGLIGSALIAQDFKSDRYFWPRPSAGGYQPLPSGGSNLGPTSQALKEKWEERRKSGFSGEMLAASASGLDPHISPEAAYAQVARVALARGKTENELKQIVQENIEPRQLGFLGEIRVNVLKLNQALEEGTR